MITSAIVYAIVCAALFSSAAYTADHAARVLRKPTRWVWFAAIVASLAWPAVGMVLPRLGPSQPAIAPVMLSVQRVTAATAPARTSRFLTLDRAIAGLWIATSLILLARLALAVRTIQRKRREWQPASMDGVSVRLADTAGPAVVGLRTMDVVVPTWLTSFDPHLRAMVLTHESEHRATRDPLLLFIAGLAVAIAPWNVAMWWQARRLRLAVELDCDARVLRRHDDSERYGMLLLTIAQRRGGAGMSFAAMLSEPVSQLERRIDAMHPRAYKRPAVRAAVAASLAIVAFIAACAIASPEGVVAPTKNVQPQATISTQPYFEFQVEKAVQIAPGNGSPRYPDAMRVANQPGEVLAQFVVRPDGSVDVGTLKVLRSTAAAFDSSVKMWLPNARFYPALVGGKAVSQVVQMPFQFNLAHDVTTAAPGAMTSQHTTYNAMPRKDSSGRPYFEFQIEKQAAVLPNSGAPIYPADLRQRNIAGEVLAQFVVTENGQADVSTFKALKSTDPLFAAAVSDWLTTAQFSAARAGDKKVKQLMQMPFSFNLAP